MALSALPPCSAPVLFLSLCPSFAQHFIAQRPCFFLLQKAISIVGEIPPPGQLVFLFWAGEELLAQQLKIKNTGHNLHSQLIQCVCGDLSQHTYILCGCLVLQRSEHSIRTPGIGITDGCKLPCVCWESNPGPLQEQVR